MEESRSEAVDIGGELLRGLKELLHEVEASAELRTRVRSLVDLAEKLAAKETALPSMCASHN